MFEPSSLWTIGGLGLWLIVLALPLLLYFVIAALQGREKKGKGPGIELGEEKPPKDQRKAG